MKIMALYGSSRKHGNSELLADRLLQGVEHTKRYLSDFRIEPIVDKRHDAEGFKDVGDDCAPLMREFLTYDFVVFVTPLYWYGMSGQMKDFIDRWSQSLRDASMDFKEKIQHMKAYVVIAGGDHPHQKGKPLVDQFKLIFDFVNMAMEGYVIGEGNKPGDVLNDPIAMQRVAEMNQVLRDMDTLTRS